MWKPQGFFCSLLTSRSVRRGAARFEHVANPLAFHRRRRRVDFRRLTTRRFHDVLDDLAGERIIGTSRGTNRPGDCRPPPMLPERLADCEQFVFDASDGIDRHRGRTIARYGVEQFAHGGEIGRFFVCVHD